MDAMESRLSQRKTTNKRSPGKGIHRFLLQYSSSSFEVAKVNERKAETSTEAFGQDVTKTALLVGFQGRIATI